MPAAASLTNVAPTDLARRLVGLVNLYRILIPPLLLGLRAATLPEAVIGSAHPPLFLVTCLVYFAAGVALVTAQKARWPSLRVLTLAHATVDAVAIALIVFASGGVASGLGILLVVPVGAIALLADERDALLIAALSALALLAQQIAGHWLGTSASSDYPAAGVLGAVVFLVALIAWPIASRLRESEALVRRQEVDLANLAQLSQYIVQHLRESILVVDTQDRIRLINESAAQMLGDRQAYPGALLGEASPKLLYLLSLWRQKEGAPGEETGQFVASDGARVIQPHFAPLGGTDPAPVLVFLEDTGLIAEKVQQSKLAALGRLSASIAHEIRNPVGAMSHASQLLAESPTLAPEDQRLTTIIRANADRVSGIIENILQMSRREAPRLETLGARRWLEDFREEFCDTMQWPRARLAIAGPGGEVDVRADRGQLRQIVWNLCENAIKHGVGEREAGVVELRYGRMPQNARPFIEVLDQGAGISPQHIERIFEPFFSGAARGTGLGLFLARELAQTNGATLLYEPRPEGGSLFRVVFADPQRWEL
jgi:two-component system sensor histidine kinase PilS (NtrC family)